MLEGRWKGIRLQRRSAPIQLFDLANDLGEKENVADAQRDVVARIAGLMKAAHVESPLWPVVEPPGGAGKKVD